MKRKTHVIHLFTLFTIGVEAIKGEIYESVGSITLYTTKLKHSAPGIMRRHRLYPNGHSHTLHAGENVIRQVHIAFHITAGQENRAAGLTLLIPFGVSDQSPVVSFAGTVGNRIF